MAETGKPLITTKRLCKTFPSMHARGKRRNGHISAVTKSIWLTPGTSTPRSICSPLNLGFKINSNSATANGVSLHQKCVTTQSQRKTISIKEPDSQFSESVIHSGYAHTGHKCWHSNIASSTWKWSTYAIK